MTNDSRRGIRRHDDRSSDQSDGPEGYETHRRQPSDRRRPVLLVSADPDQVDMYMFAFRSARVDVLSATSRDHALELIRDHSVSAIVLDIVSDQDWQTCESFIAAGSLQTPVIALTGWLSEDAMYQKRAFAMGCAGFVAKPALPEHLQVVVERARSGERRLICLSSSSGVDIAP